MREKNTSLIVATEEKFLRHENATGRSSIMMHAGYFYGFAHSEAEVQTPQGVAIAVGDNGIKGPFHKATEARTNAEGRVSNTVLNGAADQAWMTAVKLHGPDSKEAMRYVATKVSADDISSHAASVDAPTTKNTTVAGLATDRGVDPLSSFRALAETGVVEKDDIRQLAAAYTHPDEEQRLPMPDKFKRSVSDVRLDRDDTVTHLAIQRLERAGMKNRAAEAYEDLGVSIAKKGNPASAMPFLMASCTLAREHTREHGRDVRPFRPTRRAFAAEER